MRHETWVSVKAREVIDRTEIQLSALVQGHHTGAWPDLKGRTVIVNGQRLSVCIVERQVVRWYGSGQRAMGASPWP